MRWGGRHSAWHTCGMQPPSGGLACRASLTCRRYARRRCRRLELLAQRPGQLVAELREVLLRPAAARPRSALGVDASAAPRASSAAMSRPADVERAAAPARAPIGVSTASASPSQRRKIHASTRLFSPKPGHRNLPVVVLAEPVDVEDPRQLGGVAARADLEPVARSSRPCCSRRTAASRTGRSAAGRPRPAAAAVVSELIVAPEEDAVLPVEGLVHERHDRRAAAAEQERVDRHAGRVLPLGGDRRVLRGGRREAGVGMRGRRLGVGRPVVAVPVDQRGRAAPRSCPPTRCRRRRSARSW